MRRADLGGLESEDDVVLVKCCEIMIIEGTRQDCMDTTDLALCKNLLLLHDHSVLLEQPKLF